MYSIDREQGAKVLNMSTRTIDRYIRSWKLRSKKVWKKVFLHNTDVEILKNWWIQEEYEIINSKELDNTFVKTDIWTNYKDLYSESKIIIQKKDEIIQDLSYRLWNTEAELKNSISLIEYKKATFLLESSSSKVEEEKNELNSNINKLESKVKISNNINIFLVLILLISLILISFLWFRVI
ncbi:MAG: hypothetical protein ACD_4C00143G0006 [uncultured bacterium (gcode 4)]|uniref:Uncharacterized protein n=1 Tax=uncultured bacterium (gcode 4) TaxID=1234023 RepID=K2F6R4_9BACT|nr:MAG: hypothetical protein ACD_4C00143G0006 [uncultured bacterium (gcode 4)]